jgi:nucleoside-diphosphate-sugar epimerase
LLKSSSKLIYNALVNNNFAGVPPLERPGHGWVDVRDVAAAHIKALETPEAGGERILLSAGSFVWEDFS